MGYDIYLQENSKVLKNKLGITDDAELQIAESALVRANMNLLYEAGFSDFSSEGICKIHEMLFGDVYDWAGEYRKINIQKREKILAGRSVWYSNCEVIEDDLNNALKKINRVNWKSLNQKDFVREVSHLFPLLWQVHPFREGNTRTIVLLIAFFSEYYGYYFDYELMEVSAGYVRDALVMCCLGENSEYEHLEKILTDAVSEEPIESPDTDGALNNSEKSKYKQYYSENYKPAPHEYIED